MFVYVMSTDLVCTMLFSIAATVSFKIHCLMAMRLTTCWSLIGYDEYHDDARRHGRCPYLLARRAYPYQRCEAQRQHLLCPYPN